MIFINKLLDFRIYNPRIAKFLSVDPLTAEYPWYTPYQFAGNKPIVAIDLDGLEELLASDGKLLGEGPLSDESKMKLTQAHSLKRLAGEQMKVLSPDNDFLSTPVGSQVLRKDNKIIVSQFNIFGELIGTKTMTATGKSANTKHISNYSAKIIANPMLKFSVNEVFITSNYRDAATQARVMHENLLSYESLGKGLIKNLYYAKPGDQVMIRATLNESSLRMFGVSEKVRKHIVQATMTEHITSLGQSNVSRHSIDPDILNVIDISPEIKEIYLELRKIEKIDQKRFFTPYNSNDKAFHIEINQRKDEK